MKLNFGRKFVLFVHWLLSLVLCALTVALIVWPDWRETAPLLLKSMPQLIYAIAVLVVYLLFAVGTVGIVLGGKKNRGERGFIIVDSSETGRTRISVSAVEQMIRQAVRNIDGIANMKSEIINGEDAIMVEVDATLVNGAHVPTVTTSIRRSIRSYIELNCGVTVREVRVNVHSLTEPEQPSRRGRRREAEPAPAPVEPAPIPVAEPEPVPAEPAPEPIKLQLDVPEVPAVEPISQTVQEESVPAAAGEAAEPKKGGLFKKLFAKREEDVPVQTEEETFPTEEEPTAETVDASLAQAPEEHDEI